MTGPVRRLRTCVEAWPEAETGAYNPRCCRFPKSCSATIYGDGIDPEWLEPVQTLAASIMAAPHGAWSCQMGGQPHAGTCDEPTPISAPDGCPTCSGPIRETVGMVCQTCGTDYDPCPFCEIAAGRAPATVIGEWRNRRAPNTDPHIMAIVPLNPVVPGHLIVFPAEHVTSARDDAWITGRVALRAVEVASRYVSYNLITSVGVPATQTVRHLHWHVVPRVEGDGLHLPWTGQR